MGSQQISRLQRSLQDLGLSAAVIANFDDSAISPNFLYCTGYEGYGLLFVPAKGSATLFTAEMEMARAGKSGIAVQLLGKNTLKNLKKKIKKNVGIDFPHTSLSVAHRLREELKGKPFVNIAATFDRLRLVKTPGELHAVKKACEISDKIYAATLRNFKKFKTEQEVANFMNTEAAKQSVPLSFSTIVASGKNASSPHHHPTNKPLQKGFCVIDFGVKVGGYCSDTTRTFFIGNPSKKEKELYAIVLHAQTSALEQTKRERRGSALHQYTEKQLGKYKKYFIHSLGHGVGLEIHEPPSLGSHSKHSLLDDVPFTIEPGIYFANKLGIRIEDTAVLKKGKPVLLTKFPKTLIRG